MESVTARRRMLDRAFVYKILRNKIDWPTLQQSFKIRVPSRLPRHFFALLRPPASSTNLKHFSAK